MRTASCEIREDLGQRHRIRQDVEHTAAIEDRRQDLFVEPGRDVDAAVGDAVVVGRRRCKTFRAPLGRSATSTKICTSSGESIKSRADWRSCVCRNSSDNGTYTLTVTNDQGTASTIPATVSVIQPPS